MYHIIFIRVLQIAIHLYFFPGENISTGKILLLWFFNSNENGLWNKQIDQLPQSRLIILKFAISSTSFPSPFIANDLATPFNFGEPVQPTSSVLTALVAALKKEREREMETEEKRGSKRYTRRIYTWPAPSRARTRNNVHYASLTRFLPLSACFSAGEKCQGPERKMEGDEKSRAASLPNLTITLLRSTLSSFSKKGRRERNLRSSEESANRTCDSWTRSHLSLACYCLVSIVWLAATESLRHVPKTS